VLLQPERINSYAAALVRKVRKHIDEIGVIPETELLAGALEYADMSRLPKGEEEVILRAMHLMVVDRGLCIRQHIPGSNPLLIFPSLYKRQRPERPSYPLILMKFQFEGHLDEIYATLVVRLNYTDTFKCEQLWLDAADFVSLVDEKIGLKMTRHEGQGEITVFADGNVSENSRLMFVMYIYEHLKARDLNCVRIRHYVCEKCKEPFGDQAAIDRARERKHQHVFCSNCGKKIILDDIIEQGFSAKKTDRQAREMQEKAQAVLDNESKELMLVGHAFVVAGEAGQIFRPTPNSDWGIDGEIEFKDKAGKASGQRVYLQLKSGDSYLHMRKRTGVEVFTIKNDRHPDYWREQPCPVMLVVRTSDGRIRWMDVRAYLQREHYAGRVVRQFDFSGEPFTAHTLLVLRDKLLGADPAPSGSKSDERLRLLREQLRTFKPDRDDHLMAVTLGNIADVLQSSGEIDEPLRILREEVLPVYENRGDDKSRAIALGKIANLLQSRGELDEALRVLRGEVLPLYDRLGDDRSRALTASSVADVLQSRGELDEALRVLRGEVLPLYDRLGDDRSRAAAVIQVTQILADRGESVSSLELHLLESAAADGSIPEHTRTQATALRKRIRNDRVLRWRRWLEGLLPEDDFHSLPRADVGFPAVEVQAVRLRHIRAFEDSGWLTFVNPSNSKPRAYVLILGDNTAGKTTILRCIALAALGPELANQVERRPESYLRSAKEVGYIEVQFYLRLDDGVPPVGTTFCVGVKIVKGENSFRPMDDGEMSLRDEHNAAGRVGWLRRLSRERFGFLCGYGALRALIEQPVELVPEDPKEALDPIVSLFRPGAPLLDLDILGRLLTGDLSNFRSAPSKQLDPEVQKALRRHLDMLLPSSSGVVEQRPSMLRVHGQEIFLRDLSEGYASLLAMAGHLFYHTLSALNWQDDPAAIPGVVLIDEIDVHLHPSWQRRVMTDMQSLFPRLQIICTSHSALVAGSVPTNAIVVLRRDGESIQVLTDKGSVQGWRADQILTSWLFDLPTSRDLATQEKLKRYAELLNHHGPEHHEVRTLGKEVAQALELEGEGIVDRKTHELLDALLAQKFKKLKAETRQLVLAQAGLMLSDGEDEQ
jgi:hypothetical protein